MHADSSDVEARSERSRAQAISTVLAGMAEPARVEVLLALLEYGDLSLNLLSDITDQAPTTALDHLTWLRLNRLVTIEQEGARVFYRLADPATVAAIRRLADA